MGKALEDSGVSLRGRNLKRCSSSAAKFKHHEPGHVRSAQELANVFYRSPALLGTGVKKLIFNGTINDNLGSLKNKI